MKQFPSQPPVSSSGASRWSAGHATDPWLAIAGVVVVTSLIAGLVGLWLRDSDSRAYLAGVLILGSVGLVCATRGVLLTAVIAALLVAAEVHDPAPVATWAVAGGLLFMFALQRERLDAVVAGVLFAGAGALADEPWSGQILGGGVFAIFTLAAAMVGVGQWVQAQRRYEIAEIGRRHEEAERRREEVARTVVEERLRIARDLHDSVAHHFAVVSVQANLGRASLATSPQAADRALESVQLAARSALEELQLLLGVLRDESATSTQPTQVRADDIRDLAASYQQIGLEIDISGPEVFDSLSAEARAAAYRVLQEAFTNAHKYGDGRASLDLVLGLDMCVHLTVRNAIRIASDLAPSRGGHGLVGMDERVGRLGGTLSAGLVGEDFVVVARLPVPRGFSGEEASSA